MIIRICSLYNDTGLMKMRKCPIPTIVVLLLSTLFDKSSAVIDSELTPNAPPQRGQSANLLSDSPTCGPAVIAVVLKLYGKHFRTQDISRGTCVDTQGSSTIAGICDTLRNYGVYARGCRLSVDKLIERSTPTIIFVENYGGKKGRNHFVLYVGHDENDIKIIDPLFRPLQKLSREKFAQNWQNVAIITQLTPFPDPSKKKYQTWTVAMFAALLLLASTTALAYKTLKKQHSAGRLL